MKFRLKIECDNAAFKADPVGEIARILAEVTGEINRRQVIPKGKRQPIFDANGETVGGYGVDCPDGVGYHDPNLHTRPNPRTM